VDKYAGLQSVRVAVRCFYNGSVTMSHRFAARASVSGYFPISYSLLVIILLYGADVDTSIILRRCYVRDDQLDETTESIVGDRCAVVFLFDLFYLGRHHEHPDEVHTG
jgi:hypothetical protein